MRIRPHHLCFAVLLPVLAACVDPPPVPAAPSQANAKFDPAPMPFVSYGPRGNMVAVPGMPIPPKMPPGTGAYPVSSSPFRGSVSTDFNQSF